MSYIHSQPATHIDIEFKNKRRIVYVLLAWWCPNDISGFAPSWSRDVENAMAQYPLDSSCSG